MTRTASQVLDEARQALAPDADANRLVPRIAAGTAPVGTLAALAGEQNLIIDSDWRSFLLLAAAARAPAVRGFYTTLAQGEGLAAEQLRRYAAGCGLDAASLAAYQPQPGCQAYPAYLAWLATNAEPVEVAIAVAANFAAWGRYCATVATALRARYGFGDEACGFFDFFATPAPDLEDAAVAAVDADLSTVDSERAHRYGRLLQGYELMFWNTLADLPDAGQPAGS